MNYITERSLAGNKIKRMSNVEELCYKCGAAGDLLVKHPSAQMPKSLRKNLKNYTFNLW